MDALDSDEEQISSFGSKVGSDKSSSGSLSGQRKDEEDSQAIVIPREFKELQTQIQKAGPSFAFKGD